MDFDAIAGGSRSVTSLVVQALSLSLKRHSHGRRKPLPQRHKPGRPGRPAPQRDGLNPTRSFTQPVKVESLRVYEGVGHTLSRHVNHAPNADVERLTRERDIPASGSFYSEEIAQKAVEAAIEAHNAELGNWLNNGRAKGSFVRDFDMGEPVGSVLTRANFNAAIAKGAEPAPLPANVVRIVLRRSEKFSGGFVVLTAYPVPQQPAHEVPPLSVVPLQAYEGDGHTLARHVNLAPEALLGRLRSEHEITAASRFADLATAQRSIDEAITERAAEIHNWLLSGTRMPFTGDVTLKQMVGVVVTRDAFERGQLQPVPANRLHFILVRSEKYPNGFFVKTAYPVVPF